MTNPTTEEEEIMPQGLALEIFGVNDPGKFREWHNKTLEKARLEGHKEHIESTRAIFGLTDDDLNKMKEAEAREVAELAIRDYHEWLCNAGIINEDGEVQDFNLKDLHTTSPWVEEEDEKPFSELVDDFFAEHVDIDEEGHPVSTPFKDFLAKRYGRGKDD